MPVVHFTPNLKRHIDCPSTAAPGRTVAEVLGEVFRDNPRLRGYVLDDQGAVRKHIAVFVNGERVSDRQYLSDPVSEDAEVHVMQALSGG